LYPFLLLQRIDYEKFNEILGINSRFSLVLYSIFIVNHIDYIILFFTIMTISQFRAKFLTEFLCNLTYFLSRLTLFDDVSTFLANIIIQQYCAVKIW